MLIVVVITSVAATVECILILKCITDNVRFSPDKHPRFLLNFPYWIVLSALGTIFAIIGCVVTIVVYHKSRNEDFQRKTTTVDFEIPLTVVE